MNSVTFFSKLSADTARTTSVNGFKTKINSWLLENPIYSFKDFFQTDLAKFISLFKII